MFDYNSKVVEDNIKEIWDQHTYKDYNEGKKWYGEANQYSLELADKYKVTPVVSAGVLSALSPMKEWNDNKRITDQFFELVQKAPSTGWQKAAHYLGQKRKAWAIYKYAYQTTGEVVKVLHGLKTVNFFECINNPTNSDAVCVDRHMIKVATGTDRTKLTSKQYLFLKQEYLNFANRVNMIPCEAQAILWVAYKRIKKV
jgi:hypothetical protein